MSRETTPPAGAAPRQPPRKCPICGKPATPESYPFCSPRCAKVDLNRWLSGAYVIPAATSDDADDEDGRT